MIPLFGGADARAGERAGSPSEPRAAQQPPAWGTTWSAEAPEVDLDEVTAAAETALVRRLSGRQLSVSEARAFLRERGVDPAGGDAVVERCLALGYLDDARLSEQLVHAAVSRKGQGRQAIALALSKRGIDRATVAAALDELPDDEAERAADFARSRARQFRDLDKQTALRRLSGQLARRGFSSSTALSAARAALDEAAGVDR